MENNNLTKELIGKENITLYSSTNGILSHYPLASSYSIGIQALTDYDYENDEVIYLGYATTRPCISLSLKDLPINPRIKKAELKLCLGDTNLNSEENVKIGLYELNGTIADGAAVPDLGVLIDYAKINDTDITECNFDITSLVRKLALNQNESIGMCLKFMNEDLQKSCYSSVYDYESDYAENAPVLTVEYESSYSVNTSYPTHTHDLGRFGQGSIDLQTGNLMFECEDHSFGGNRMPVTIKHYYNSALSDYKYDYNESAGLFFGGYDQMNLGYGWRLNVMQNITFTTIRQDGADVSLTGFITENGEEIYFKESSLTATDSDGNSYNLYEDINGQGLIYDPVLCTVKNGDETYYFDIGRLVKIEDSNGNHMEITYTDFRISSITDGVGRIYKFTYDENNFLTTITGPDNYNINYLYDGNLLSKILYSGGATYITYANNKPQSVVLRDATGAIVYTVEYTFNGNQLASVTEYGVENGKSVIGATSNYTYYGYKTVVETVTPFDSDEGETEDHTVTTVYSFDNGGNIIGEYIYNDDIGNMGVGNSSGGINPYAGENSINIQAYNNNFLVNHAFSSESTPIGWSRAGNSAEDWYTNTFITSGDTVYGKNYACLDLDNTEDYLYQTTATLPKGNYTLSSYVKVSLSDAENDSINAYLKVLGTNSAVIAESEHLCEKSDTYTRLSATFGLAEPQTVTVQLFAKGKGTAYFNAPQLENNITATAYNILENGSFENTHGWSLGENMEISDTESFERGNSIKITGSLDSEKQTSQKVLVLTPRTTRETFTLSGWAKGQALQNYTRDGIDVTPTYRLRAVIHYNDADYGETEPETFTADFVPDNRNWQFASVQFAKSSYRTVDYIEIFCDYDYNANDVYFDNIQLTRDSIETDLTAEDFAIIEDEPETEGTTSADTEETEVADFEELLDEFGNTLTETTFQDGEFGTVYRSFEYDEQGNNLTVETDARGNKTVYTVDPVTSRNTAVTDRCGNKTAYEYDSVGRTTKVTSKKADDTEIANVGYAYDPLDNMTEIVRGDGLKYVLTYNAFRNLDAIGIDGKAENLVKYTYKTGNGRLKEITYANGDYMHATYNGLGQMIAEKWYDKDNILIAHYKYTYDGEGNIVRSIDILAEREYNYTYEDGAIQRAAEYEIVVTTDNIVTSKKLLNTIQYYYDKENALTKKRVIFADGTEQVTDFENPEEGNTIAKLTVGDKTITSHSKNDSFGRTEFEELQLGTGVISRQFDYHAGKATEEHIENGKLKSTPTTQLVSKITLSNGRTISYEYDAEERITKVTDSLDGVTEYTYDELGQLLTEKINGETVNSMTYDNYGNIVAKDGKQYTYDSTWKDLLVSVDNDTITYDAQGNPVSYLGHTLSWEKGRQLKQFDGNVYTYNANGIRNSKTVDGIRHDFVLDGVKILKETYGSHVIETLYDNSDSVCGIVYNGTAYYFLKNLQGDVISITDSTGEVVANYTYDAWGKVLSISGDNIHIGDINPYRYRGYYFDSEINMYYLQSRYYDPEVGRFVCGDSVDYLGLGGIVSNNLFAYCENNSINYVDYYGHAPSLITLALMHNAVVKSAQSFLFAAGIITTSEVLTCTKFGRYNGRMDIYSYVSNRVWEVKRNNTTGISAGLKQLKRYTSSYVYSLYHSWIRTKKIPRYGKQNVYGSVVVGNYLAFYRSYPANVALIVYDYMTLEQVAEVLLSAVSATSIVINKMLLQLKKSLRKKVSDFLTNTLVYVAFGKASSQIKKQKAIKNVCNFLKKAAPYILSIVSIILFASKGILVFA